MEPKFKNGDVVLKNKAAKVGVITNIESRIYQHIYYQVNGGAYFRENELTLVCRAGDRKDK